jgi:ribose transport system ATP-binding protein
VGRDRIAVALEARGIAKRFAGVQALAGAEIDIRVGEVHGLVGANGSGKSTLVKVLSGYHAPAQGGRVSVRGRGIRLPFTPGDARALGLRFVHQNLGLIPSLSVAENVCLDELATARRRWISGHRLRQRAAEALARLGLDIDPGQRVSSLTPLEAALVAIARAAREQPAVLVLDEPTGFLPAAERERLYELVGQAAAGASGVLLVSHDLDEVLRVADRVTVLRDGRTVATLDAGATTTGELAALMAGRGPGTLRHRRPAEKPHGGEVVFVEGLRGPVVRDLSLRIPRGEVVGLTGLAGSGFDEVTYLLFGARRARAGRLHLGRDFDLTAMTPARALDAGIGLLPATPEHLRAAGSLTLADNVMLPRLDRYSRGYGLGLDGRRLRADARSLLVEHGVTPADPRVPFATLSGGNQQKALLGKWLGLEPALLLLDEPLRGVDVHGRLELSAQIRALAARGTAVLCASFEPDLLADLCDRFIAVPGGQPA